MKILSVSDIHSDVNKVGYREDGDEWVKFSDRFNDILHEYKEIDIIMCAGDISPSVPELQHTLKLINESIDAQYYVFVPGNHDVWELEDKINPGITQKKYDVILKDVVERANFHYLPNNPLIIDDKIGIIGSIGWYDYSFRPTQYDDYLKQIGTWYDTKRLEGKVWNDVNFTNWGMTDQEVTKLLVNQLKEDYQKTNEVSQKIAVIHHVPFKEGVIYKNNIDWDFFSTFVGAACFGDMFRQWKIDVVIHGHTHFPKTYNVEPCQVYCVPIGYFTDWKGRSLTKELNDRIKVFDFP